MARDPLPLDPERAEAILRFARTLGFSSVDEGGAAQQTLEGLLTSGAMSMSLLAALDEELARSTLSGSPPSPPRDAPVSARFVVLAVLGRGAMGDVYRSFDRTLERFVALKVLRATDARARERLRKEARAQAQVEHPGVCRIFDVTEDPAPGFIAMELIDGETLDKTAAGIGFDDKLALAVQIADAVAAAHARGVLHRDLKPQNILVTRSAPRRAVVTDFGLARDLDGHAVGGVAGTPGFMAPEQARGDAQLTPATDVFGLGATLYALFSGRAPFPAPRAEALRAVLRGPPPSLRHEVPRDLAAVIDRCLATEPSHRYSNAAELADELRRVSTGDATRARPRSRGERALWRLRRRWPLALGAAALAAMLLLTAAARRRAERRVAAVAQLAAIAAREEARLREAALLPRHDVSLERSRIDARLRQLDAILPEDAAVAAARAAARGRILVAAGDPERARPALDAAYSAGERSQELIVARARLMLDTYERQLDSLVEMSPAHRAPRLRRLDAELRQPAQRDLSSLGGDAGPSVESLRATLSRDPFAEWATVFEANRVECARATRDAEPCRLAGDAAMREARRAMFEGRHREAREWLINAGAQFHDGLQIARSDPALHRRACTAASTGVTAAEWLRSRDVEVETAAAQRVCGAALLVTPDDPSVAAMAAKLGAQVAGDDRERLRAAAELSMRALAAAPDDVEVLLLAATAQTRLGEQLLYGAARLPKELDRAAELLRRAAVLLPERADIPAQLALVLLRNRKFANTADELAEASRRCAASNELVPDNLWYHTCRPQVLEVEAGAAREAGRPYRHLYEAMIAEAAATARRFPDDALAQRGWADLQLDLALELEEDRQPDVALARRSVDAMRQYARRFATPDDAWLLDTAEIVLAHARATRELVDPRPDLARVLERGLRPDERAAYAENLSHLRLVALDWCSAMGLPCADWRERAMRDLAALDRATEGRPRWSAAIVDLALALAQLAVDSGRDPTPLLRRAGAILDEDGSLQRTVRPRHELLALRWSARRAPDEAVAKARAYVASLRARTSTGSHRATFAEMIAEAHCLIASQSTAETDQDAARQAVAEYASHAPGDRLHARRLQRLLDAALARR